MHWIDHCTVRLLQADFKRGSQITISLVMQQALQEEWAEESAWLEAHRYPVKVEQIAVPADEEGSTRHAILLRFVDPDHAIAFKLRFH
jgi:hypothetical protein